MMASRASSPAAGSPPSLNLPSPRVARQSSLPASPHIRSASTSASSSRQTPPEPISIPRTPLHQRDPNRVPTPVSGRGDRLGHHFPHRDISPLRLSQSPTEGQAPSSPPNGPSSLSHRFQFLNAKMYSDRSSYYTPTSPLSSPISSALHPRPVSPQPPAHSRRQHRQSPKSAAMQPVKMPASNLPRFHPSRFESSATAPSSSATTVSDSPKAMRKYQRELLAKADYSSRLAASPFSTKPSAPRLEPLGSPGPVTPLELEGTEAAGDYFMCMPTGSPTQSSEVGGLNDEKRVYEHVNVKQGSPKVKSREIGVRRGPLVTHQHLP